MFSPVLKSVGFSVFVLLSLGGFFLGFSGSVDDAHISYWSAWALAHYGEIVNYNFDRVEQSSALLQVVLLAVLHKASGVSVVALGHITTTVFSAISLYVVARLSHAVQPQSQWGATLFLATSPFFVYWSFGGMEAPMLGLLLLCTVVCWHRFLMDGRAVLWVGVLAFLVQLSRPEQLLVMCLSALLLGVVRGVIGVQCRWAWHRIAVLIAVQVAVAICILFWRYAYFGDWWPQPVSVKVGGGWLANAVTGIRYVKDSFVCLGLLLPAALVVAGAMRALSAGMLASPMPIVVVLAAVYVAFVVASGGDWMPAGRFWVPILPLCAVLAGLVFSGARPRLWVLVTCVLVLVHVACLWRGTMTDMNGVPVWKRAKLVEADHPESFTFLERHGREHLHDIPTLAYLRPLVAQLMAIQPADQRLTIMVGQAGMVMYHLGMQWPGRLQVIDRNGLVDRALDRCSVAESIPKTRNGLGVGYEWLMSNEAALLGVCAFRLPDIVFDIDAGWNRRNLNALKARGYVVVYYQSGHMVDEGDWLPLRRIGAGQYIAVSDGIYRRLGSPVPQRRLF